MIQMMYNKLILRFKANKMDRISGLKIGITIIMIVKIKNRQIFVIFLISLILKVNLMWGNNKKINKEIFKICKI